jgi:hypothetical protein
MSVIVCSSAHVMASASHLAQEDWNIAGAYVLSDCFYVHRHSVSSISLVGT